MPWTEEIHYVASIFSIIIGIGFVISVIGGLIYFGYKVFKTMEDVKILTVKIARFENWAIERGMVISINPDDKSSATSYPEALDIQKSSLPTTNPQEALEEYLSHMKQDQNSLDEEGV